MKAILKKGENSLELENLGIVYDVRLKLGDDWVKLIHVRNVAETKTELFPGQYSYEGSKIRFFPRANQDYEIEIFDRTPGKLTSYDEGLLPAIKHLYDKS